VAITPAAAAPAVEIPVAHGGGSGAAAGAAAEQRSAWSGAGLPTPKAMVAMLDEYVVGQSEAKKVRLRGRAHTSSLFIHCLWAL
jgi:hypothetical protein